MLFTNPHITENVKEVDEQHLKKLVVKYRDNSKLPLAKIYVSLTNFMKLHLNEIYGVPVIWAPGLHDYEVHIITYS